jgi:diguanylate cyclase (GGDEF)-like protein/PAS domain S-box-containing protein
VPESRDPAFLDGPLPGVPDAHRLLVASLTDYAVIVLDPDGIVRSWNPGAERIKGWTAREIVGRSFEAFYTPESVAVDHPLRELERARTMGRYGEEGWRVRKDGSRFWAHIVITALFDQGGDLVGYGKVTQDLTARKHAEEQLQGALALLRETAMTDALTGLANRRAWDDGLARELARTRRFGGALCVAAIDIDHFKVMNDAHGHGAGDRFLRRTTTAWRSTLRASDLLARLGGEEFAVALPDCDLGSAESVADRFRSLTPDGETCSVGVAQWDGLESAETLLGRADRALYAAKDAGRNRTVLAAAGPDGTPGG